MSFIDLAVMERDWLRRDKVYAESEYPLFERWGAVLALLPDTRTRSLSDDMSDIFRRAYTEATGSVLCAAVDLALIQMRWFEFLTCKGIGRFHWIRWNVEATAVWRDKLMDRMNVSMPDHFEEDSNGELVYVPAQMTGTVRHAWMH